MVSRNCTGKERGEKGLSIVKKGKERVKDECIVSRGKERGEKGLRIVKEGRERVGCMYD